MRLSNNPVGSGRWLCRMFPEVQDIDSTTNASTISNLAERAGSSHRSTQGISPLRLKLYRYQATYPTARPEIPIIPKEKPVSSHGPAGAISKNNEFKIRTKDKSARGIHSGS